MGFFFKTWLQRPKRVGKEDFLPGKTAKAVSHRARRNYVYTDSPSGEGEGDAVGEELTQSGLLGFGGVFKELDTTINRCA